jgi:hypothetical protein
MEKKKLDKIIQIIREQMVANAPGTQGGFSASSKPSGPTAGYDPILGKKINRRKYASGGKGSRKLWLDYLRTTNNGRRS